MLQKRTVMILIAVSVIYVQFLKDSSFSIHFKKLLLDYWRSMYMMFGENDYLTILLGTFTLVQVIFVCIHPFFIYADFTGKPKWMNKYKIQEKQNNPLDKKKFLHTLKLVMFNHLITSAFSATLLGYCIYLRNVPCNGNTLPTIPQLSFHLLVYIVVVEVGFYYVHRLLHHPILYSLIHKIHHEWHAPVSITQFYCHPLEHFILNHLTITLGTIVLGDNYGNHLISFWVWLIIVDVSSAIVHSGYHLPFLLSSQEHDYHHSRFNQNFGTIGVMDYIHGTNGSFLNSISYKRHTFLLGLSSANELIPDKKII